MNYAYCESYATEEINAADELHPIVNVSSDESINICNYMNTYSQDNVHASITLPITEANTNDRRSPTDGIAQSTQRTTDKEVAIYVLWRIANHLDDESTRNESNKRSDEINYLHNEAGGMSQNDQAESVSADSKE